MHLWIITEDNCNDPHRDYSAVGTRGGLVGVLRTDQVLAHHDAVEFELWDEDYQVMFRGVYVGPQDDKAAMFEPLDLFGQFHGQCVAIAYRNCKGEWAELQWGSN